MSNLNTASRLRLHDPCACGKGTYSNTESLTKEERIELGIGRLLSAYCTACHDHEFVSYDKHAKVAPALPKRMCSLCGDHGCFRCTGKRG